jgi:copper chaperone CopZ
MVRTIDCVACSPAFKRELGRLGGVRSVRALVMLNKILVEFDPSVITEERIKEKIMKVGSKAGFEGKIVFLHN